MRSFAFALAVAPLVLAACGNKMEKIDAMRAALISDDATKIDEAAHALPSCDGPTEACVDAVSRGAGSPHGFSLTSIDQATATAAGVILVRDKHGEALKNADTWMQQLKTAKGTGADVLRLAVARRMAEVAPTIAKPVDSDGAVPAFSAAVASAVAGACETYARIGAGESVVAMSPDVSPDHSACVQHDLSRREGPGGRYGTGLLRACEGAAAVWREEERALRMGLQHMTPEARAVVEAKLKMIEPATLRISIKKVENADMPADVSAFMNDIHADAGVFLVPKDGGAPEGGVIMTDGGMMGPTGIPVRMPTGQKPSQH